MKTSAMSKRQEGSSPPAARIPRYTWATFHNLRRLARVYGLYGRSMCFTRTSFHLYKHERCAVCLHFFSDNVYFALPTTEVGLQDTPAKPLQMLYHKLFAALPQLFAIAFRHRRGSVIQE